MNQFIQKKNTEFRGVVEFFKKEINNLRVGRANPGMFDGIQVEAYGARTPLNGLANISVQDAKSMIVSPWDKGALKELEKAIVGADLGVGVVNEGDKIRVTIPQMTEEKRRELVKKLNEKLETVRVSARQVRDAIKEDIEAAEKSNEINEDDKFRFIKELDEETRKLNDELKEIRDKKEEEIMTV